MKKVRLPPCIRTIAPDKASGVFTEGSVRGKKGGPPSGQGSGGPMMVMVSIHVQARPGARRTNMNRAGHASARDV
jgi:hypothetical protein